MKIVQQLAETIARKHFVSVATIMGRRRDPITCRARWELWKALRKRGWSNGQIAMRVDRDPSTVSHGINRI